MFKQAHVIVSLQAAQTIAELVRINVQIIAQIQKAILLLAEAQVAVHVHIQALAVAQAAAVMAEVVVQVVLHVAREVVQVDHHEVVVVAVDNHISLKTNKLISKENNYEESIINNSI